MRLKSIKLAGFKSFVDPTTVPFPSNLTAVVGPNGCGKSNIIDAVRWVMGESSAKNLRGESMTDVIFNGATTRKPVGQASIELVFDNTEGKLVGEYAKFSEISVKRRVSREGASDYFLNGTKCRRRDITDIFLGTGLGPRSYAIIEQGMISKLIESKPEELRIFIEEAAGISKYKERRKETESRLRRTQENLDRLTDIREELERQLRHLHKQAQAAEKYTTLKAEERLLKAQIAALKWQELNGLVEQKQSQISEAELELEEAVTNRVSHETRIEQLRIAHSEKNDEYNKAQAEFYATGSEIAKLEQSIRHNKDRLTQLDKDRKESQWQIEELKREQAEESARLNDLVMELEELSPVLEEQLLLAEETAEALETAEESMHLWQQKWDDFNLQSSNARTQAEIEQNKIQQFENNIRKTSDQISRLSDECTLLETQVSTVETEAAQEELFLIEEKEEEYLHQKEEIFDVLSVSKKRVLELDNHLNDLRTESQTLRGKIASLIALQDSAAAASNSESDLIIGQSLNEKAERLLETLKVEAGWDQAVESALSYFMSGYCVASTDPSLIEAISGSKGKAALIERQTSVTDSSEPSKANTLSSVVLGDNPLRQLTDHILLADDIQFAMSNRGSLADTEYFVCKNGVLVGSNWLVKPDDSDVSKGVLQRQRDLEQSNERLSELVDQIKLAEEESEQLRAEIKQREERREEIILQVSQVEREKSAIKQKLSTLEIKQTQLSTRVAELQQSQALAEQHLTSDQEALQESRHAWQEALSSVDSFADEKEALLAERDRAREALDNLRQKSRHEKDVSHRQQLQLQSLESEKRTLEKDEEKNENQVNRLQERLGDIELQFAELDEPIETMQLELEQLLDKRLTDEEKLAVTRQALEQVDIDLRSDEHNRQTVEQRVQILRNALQEIRMESQALEIKRNGIRDQLRQDSYELDAVLEALPEEANLEESQLELEKIGNRVQRLGAINLAAIDEYKTQSERKTYLDEQNDDLVEAITTLENAIRKIDKETRAKFKETYDKVNTGLQNLFPKVFGGGSAYLELTGDDLLETGVAIMARPPGKKNSTIHLLSGGEKALTAIALVFSIFQLNPAPFCMLDEVDAPLDDANVARYANMVREMSSQVQFIYISHNKIAMEMADQLMGVTMHEPGVSRLVSVNVDEAAALAAI